MVEGDGGTGGAAGSSCRSGTLQLACFQSPANPDLTDDPGTDRGSGDSDRDVSDDDLGQVLYGSLVHVRWVKALNVESRSHDQVQTAGIGDLEQARGVPSQSDAGTVDDSTASPALEIQHFAEGQIDVA